MKLRHFTYLIFSSFLLVSCATSGLLVSNSQKETELFPENKKKLESFYIVGNASDIENSQVLKALQNKIEEDSTQNKYIIFSGDNVKAKKNEDEKLEKQLDAQIEVATATAAHPFFIPGNFEWEYNGTEGLEKIEDYLEEKLQNEEVLTPNNGCPLESLEINKDLQLLVVDSQWYIENWYLSPNINDKCEIKTREKLFAEIDSEIKKNANKTIIFAMHHPIYTNGLHGGRFSFRDHIFPLQGNIPIPVVGTLVAQIRSQGGISLQDRFNKRYNELMNELKLHIDIPGRRIIVVSGHEENLQYIEQNNIRQIVSAAGTETTPVSLSNNGLFAYGGNGFASLDFMDDGSVWTQFYGVDEMGKVKVLFQKKILETVAKPVLDTLPQQFPKTYKTSVYDLKKIKKSDFFKSFWGKHYRDIYGTEVTAPTALLDTLYGGLKVMRPGGGHQTRSLRLETKDGKEYNMRALKKSAIQFLESTTFKGIDGEVYFTNTVPDDLILDFYTAAHPYGAFAIPKLAQAAQVFYTTPELFYVPQQKALGKYNKAYGDQLYMIVEKPSKDFKNRESFGYPDDVESTDDLLQKLRSDEDHILDEEAYIRARIFDMLIGDWDRHSDQWRWAEFKNAEGKKVFVPIPRDRDQVFANFDGSLLNLLRSITGAANQFGVYGEDITDVAWFNKAGSKLDRALIKRSGKDVWIAQAQFLQNAIDADILNNAFNSIPKEVQDETMEEIKEKFLLRKNNLVNIVERYYEHYMKFQMLTGTDKDDYFEIIRLPKGKTQIAAYRIKDGEKGDVLFDRVFDKKETKEIWLYGLDDDDVFVSKGKPDNPILIRVIGGQDEDKYDIEKGRNIKVYDNRAEKRKIEKRGGAQFRFTKFYETNLYDYQKEKATSGSIGLDVGFNPDDGTTLTARYEKDKNIFLLNPYSRRTQIWVDYQFLTQGFDVRVNKGFASIFSDFNAVVSGRYTSKNYTENFFGIGNETENMDTSKGLDYNRVNMEIYKGGLGVERESKYGSFFQVKYDVNTVRLVKNGDNYINQTLPNFFEERKYFGIPNTTYRYKNYDDVDFPTKGMLFSVTGGAIDDLRSDNLTGFIDSSIIFYNSLTSSNQLVLKTQAKTYITVLDEPEFYQKAQLGGNTGLRGYRDQRFTGDSSLAGSAEVSYTFEKIKTFLFPLTCSVFGGYDVGRVWVKQESSNIWHDSYGGGVVLKWTNAIKGGFSAFNSDEGTRLSFRLAIRY